MIYPNMEIEKGEKEPRPRISLYLEKEVTHRIDDMRLLMTFNGGNMDSIPEFTDMIDALIVFAYRFSYPELQENFLKKFVSEKNSDHEQSVNEEEFSSYYEIFKEVEALKYDIQTGYEAKLYNLKDPYRDLIERSITNIKNTTGLTVDYSTFIKKSIDFVFGHSASFLLKWAFFKYIYIGGLYNLSPATSLKFALLNKNDYTFKEITPLEIKQIKLLNSDSRIITELIKILREIKDQDSKKQFDFLVDKFLRQKNSLKSILWNFNYVDAFFGYVYSVIYLIGSFKSIISFMEEIALTNKINDILSSTSKYEFTDASKGKMKMKKEADITGHLTSFIKDLQRFHTIAYSSLQFNVTDIEDLNKIENELEKKANELFDKV